MFLRRLIKLILAGTLYYTGLLKIYAKRRRAAHPEERFKILTYHRVLEDRQARKADTQPGMCVTKHSFTKQMKFLSEQYDPISLGELSDALENNRPLPEKAVVVTFDDGWLDNYTIAFPILEQLNVPAIIFLPTDLIKSDKLPAFIHASLLLGEPGIWPDKAVAAFKEVVAKSKLDQTDPALEGRKLDATRTNAFNYMVTLMHLRAADLDKVIELMMSSGGIESEKWYSQRWLINWDEIREMNRSVISFGSHGQSHDLMTDISLEQVKAELVESRRVIEAELSQPIKLFSYPNGNYNEDVKEVVREAGYSCAVTQDGCLDNEQLPDRYSLRRLNMNEGATLGPLGRFSKTIFACKIEGIY